MTFGRIEIFEIAPQMEMEISMKSSIEAEHDTDIRTMIVYICILAMEFIEDCWIMCCNMTHVSSVYLFD